MEASIRSTICSLIVVPFVVFAFVVCQPMGLRMVGWSMFTFVCVTCASLLQLSMVIRHELGLSLSDCSL